MKLMVDILWASIVGSLSFIIVTLIYWIKRKKCSARYRKVGWILVGFWMLLPLHISAFPSAYTVEIPNAIIKESEISGINSNIGYNRGFDGLPEHIGQSVAKTEITTNAVIMFLWILVAGLLLVYYFTGYWILYRRNLRWSIVCQDENILNEAEKIAKEFNLKKIPEIRVMEDANKGPFTTGLWRKIIYIPVKGLLDSDIEYILKHEMFHCKEHDLFWKTFFAAVTIVHWFNPFVWILRKHMNQDMEIVCDEAVVKNVSAREREEYSNVIMSWIEHSQSPYQWDAFSTSYVSGHRFLKWRFANIFDNTDKRGGKMLVGVTLTVLLLCSAVIHVEVAENFYFHHKIAIDEGLEVRTDVDGDGTIERVYVKDIVSGDYAFTQVTAVFGDGNIVFKNYDEDFYNSYIIVGDLTENDTADVVVMKYSRGSTFGGGDVSVLHMEKDEWEEYPCKFIKNLSLDMDQPDNFSIDNLGVSWLGATIIEKDKRNMLRLVMAVDMTQDIAMCIDCSYQDSGWYIESAELIQNYYSEGKSDELLKAK